MLRLLVGGAGGEVVVGNRRAALVGTGIVVAALVGLNVAIHLARRAACGWVRSRRRCCWGYARLSGLSWAQLGLGRDRIRCGAVCAAGAIAAVGVVYLVGVLQPATRLAFLGARCHLDVAGALLSALVVIPVGTVLLEEVAFPVRGLTHLGPGVRVGVLRRVADAVAVAAVVADAGLVSGSAVAQGYGIGVVLAWASPRIGFPGPSDEFQQRVRRGTAPRARAATDIGVLK